jgi:hypothetical protein
MFYIPDGGRPKRDHTRLDYGVFGLVNCQNGQKIYQLEVTRQNPHENRYVVTLHDPIEGLPPYWTFTDLNEAGKDFYLTRPHLMDHQGNTIHYMVIDKTEEIIMPCGKGKKGKGSGKRRK